jgi:hypothetical protein
MKTASRTAATSSRRSLNGLDLVQLKQTADAVAADPKNGSTSWKVSTSWKGGTRSDTRVTSFALAGREIPKDFTIAVDEPLELCGTNRFANPQEYLLAALNACMVVGYVANCALEGITLRELRIETSGDIDLRGFLGLDPSVKPGYDSLRYTAYVKSDASPMQMERIHDVVCRTSPNRFNLSQPVRLDARLVAE